MLDEVMHEKSKSTQAQAKKTDAPVMSRPKHTQQVYCVSQVQAQAEFCVGQARELTAGSLQQLTSGMLY